LKAATIAIVAAEVEVFAALSLYAIDRARRFDEDRIAGTMHDRSVIVNAGELKFERRNQFSIVRFLR